MSGLAVFGLKYPSLLNFDEGRNEAVIRHNLHTLYGVEQAPCDTQLRTILDPVDPQRLRGAFRAVHQQLRRDKVLEPYRYLGEYYLVSIDGTGHFASDKVSCSECCVKTTAKGETHFYHQLLCAVLIHPDQATVFPLLAEAITRQDGQRKNDCERSAAKRLLRKIKEDHPSLKLVIVEDSLSSNGPHINLLKELGYHYILGVKAGDHPALFEAVKDKMKAEQTKAFEWTDECGVIHGFRFVNEVSLNKSHTELQVNYLDYWEVRGEQELNFTWITDIPLSKESVNPVMRGGRGRWKIENETFNTLKNQAYHLEHNYGHGRAHLATVFALLMLLAFLVDQVQEWCCDLFKAARKRFRSRTSLWLRMRAFFLDFYISSWEELWQSIIKGHRGSALQPDTS
jgi:Transposase DDE domain.